jgi:hypothetical protein
MLGQFNERIPLRLGKGWSVAAIFMGNDTVLKLFGSSTSDSKYETAALRMILHFQKHLSS